jgi:hypothetical protein
MGEIFRGRHRVLGHTVAVKVMIPDAARDGATTERFLREARIAARLRHPHVVRVEDFGVSDDGRSYLVMELLRGESLARRLARAPRLTFTRGAARRGAAGGGARRGPRRRHRAPRPEAREHLPLRRPRRRADREGARFRRREVHRRPRQRRRTPPRATRSSARRATCPPSRRARRATSTAAATSGPSGMLVYEMLTGAAPLRGRGHRRAPRGHPHAPHRAAELRPPRAPAGPRRLGLSVALAGRSRDTSASGATGRARRRPTADALADPPPSATAVAPPPRDPRKESIELRTSWRSGLLAGLVAASAIFGLARLRESSRPRAAAVGSPVARMVPAAPTPAVEPAPRRLVAPDAAPSPAEVTPAPEASVENPRAGRRRGHHRRHRRPELPSSVTPTAPGGGMYDPSGI